MYTLLGTYIRERRQDLGLSQEQLAERVGGTYCQSDVSRLERGHVELPRLGTLISLAASLEVPVGNLLIASGWFSEGHFGAAPQPADDAEHESLKIALSEIEIELDAIRDLEHEAESRSNQLRAMIRDLKAFSGTSVSMVELKSQGQACR